MRSYSYIADIVDGCILALDKFDQIKGEIFNLGTDEPNTTAQGIKLVENFLGKPARFVILPRRSGDQLTTTANITKARQMLGYSPKTTLVEGLKKQIEWYRHRVWLK